MIKPLPSADCLRAGSQGTPRGWITTEIIGGAGSGCGFGGIGVSTGGGLAYGFDGSAGGALSFGFGGSVASAGGGLGYGLGAIGTSAGGGLGYGFGGSVASAGGGLGYDFGGIGASACGGLGYGSSGASAGGDFSLGPSCPSIGTPPVAAAVDLPWQVHPAQPTASPLEIGARAPLDSAGGCIYYLRSVRRPRRRR